MSSFFESLEEKNMFADWASTLDWLVDDKKFSAEKGWSSGYVGSLAKRVKKLSGFSEGSTYICTAIKNLHFPVENKIINGPYAIFSDGDGEAKSFIKHIRNGIAHGNSSCFIRKGELYIEIKDYSDSSHKHQTAYFFFPASYVVQVHDLYLKVKKSINKAKSKKERYVYS